MGSSDRTHPTSARPSAGTAPRPPVVAPLSRRAVVAGGCAALCLAGCARYGAENATPTPAEPGGSTAPRSAGSGSATGGVTGGSGSAGGGAGVVAASAIPVGGGVVLPDRALVVTQPTAGVFAAFGTTCPHQGCSVNEVTDGTINCPCHGSRFRVEDGSVARGPAKKGLTPKAATQVDGQIQVS